LTGTGADAEQPESPSKKNLIKAKEDVGKLKEENKNLREQLERMQIEHTKAVMNANVPLK